MSSARTSLAELSDRLRRSLGLVGTIDADFKAEGAPVVVSMDATLPGYSTFRGRRWIYRMGFGTGTQQAVKALAPEGIIIDGLSYGAQAAAGTISVAVLGYDQADPWAIATANVTWAERLRDNLDVAPIVTGTNVGAFGGTVLLNFTLLSNTATGFAPFPYHLAQNAKLGFTGTGAGATHQVTLWGRIA